jgi:sphingomyelin phosphodiesterase acid-like 3
MINDFRCIMLLLVVNIGLICGCSSDSSTYPATTTNFTVVVFTDIHFNPFYDIIPANPELFQKLVSSDVSQWASIFQGSTMATPSPRGNDTNYPLLVLALSGIKQNLGASPLAIFTGDILRHGLTANFYKYYGVVGVPTAEDVAAMQAFTNKTVAFIMDQVRSSIGNIPVMFAVGNSDSYSLIDDGPDSTFLANTADYYYTKLLNRTVDQQSFLSTFKAGGYYSAELPGTNLLVIGLNTVPFTNSNQPNLVTEELAWLESKVASAKAAGKKVWLLMHVPPGASIVQAANSVDVNGHITTAPMMWSTDNTGVSIYQDRLLNIFKSYPGVVTLTLAAHTHMDEYRIMTPTDVLEITPGITPYFGNNPAFKVFTFAKDTLKPIDYRSINYDLDAIPAQFKNYYTFSQEYLMQEPLDASLILLSNTFATSSLNKQIYGVNFNSGNTSLTPVKYPNGNSYTPVIIEKSSVPPYMNWPVFLCGIKHIDQTNFSTCVNSYVTTLSGKKP